MPHQILLWLFSLASVAADVVVCSNGRPGPQATDTDNLYCTVTCSGSGTVASNCENALMGVGFNIFSDTMFEFYFDQPTTLGALQVDVVSGALSQAWIASTDTDTSDPNYVNFDAYNNGEYVTRSAVTSLTGTGALVKITDPEVTSKYWAIAMRIDTSVAATAQISNLKLRGVHGTSVYGPWTDFNDCACRLQVRSRDCFSTVDEMCAMWPATESVECDVCTCSTRDRMICTDDFLVQNEPDCPLILDDDLDNFLNWDGEPDGSAWRVLFEFRDDGDPSNDYVTVHIQSIQWLLTDDSDVNIVDWSLLIPVDPANPNDEFKQLAARQVQSHDIEWTFTTPVEASMLIFRFEPHDGSGNVHIGVKDVHVKGFVPDDYPGHNCYTVGEPENAEDDVSFPVWVIAAIVGCCVTLIVLICCWCFQVGCFKRDEAGDRISEIPKHFTHSDTGIEMQNNGGDPWGGLDAELRGDIQKYRRDNQQNAEESTEESSHAMEGQTTMHTDRAAGGYGREGTSVHDMNAPGASQSQIAGLPERTIDYFFTFTNRVQLDELLTTNDVRVDRESARVMLAALRGVKVYAVADHDDGLKILNGLNKAQLESKLRNLTESGIAMLEGPQRGQIQRQGSAADLGGPGIGRFGRGLTQASERLPNVPVGDWEKEGTGRSAERGATDHFNPNNDGEPFDHQTTTVHSESTYHMPAPPKGFNRMFSEEAKMSQPIRPNKPLPREQTGENFARDSVMLKSSIQDDEFDLLPKKPLPYSSGDEEAEGGEGNVTGAPGGGPEPEPASLPRVIFKYADQKKGWRPTQLQCYVSMCLWLQENLEVPDEWKLEYTDADGDTLQINSDDDISEALREVANSKKSKLYVTVVSTKNAGHAPGAGEGEGQPYK